MAAILSLLLGATVALAQTTAAPAAAADASPLPLTEYHYSYSDLPYQVYPYAVGRGPQSGYNICNSTTEGPESQCQTLIVNSAEDFCLWGSPTQSGGLIGNIEAAVVAYCSQPGHGTRVMPAGTLTGVQFMKTPGYIQVTGHLNQAGVGLDPTDTGGELDPHGADLAGNPLGGVVFSNNLPTSSSKTTYVQGENWSQFIGGGMFCIKVCDNTIKSPDYCQNIYDLLGCTYNMPAAYTDNEFTSCEGDVQMEPGVYVSDGQTITWKQPASLTPDTTLPWQPSIPPSSSCTTLTSAQIYSAQSGTVAGASASVTPSSSASVAAATGATAARSSASVGAKSTGTASPTATGVANGAMGVTVSSTAGLIGVVFAAVFFS